MAHSAVKPIWKFSWKPDGYGIQDYELDTTGKTLGSMMFFPHTFFRGKEFSASLSNGNSLTIGYEDKALTGEEDLILRLYDAKLSQLGNSGVYRAVELVSPRVLDQKISIKINYIADIMDPEDFGQKLNSEADVTHKSLTVEKLKSGVIEADSLDINNDLEGPWGSLTKNAVAFKAPLLAIDGVTLEKEKVTFEKPLAFECGGTRGRKGVFSFNAEHNTWETYNPRAKKTVPFITSHEATDDIPEEAIPVIDGNDPTALSFRPWLKVNGKKKTLEVDNLNTKAIQIDGKDITVAEGAVIRIGSHMIQDQGDVLNIDDILHVNRKSQEVTFCGVTVDMNFLENLRSITKRLDALESKVKE